MPLSEPRKRGRPRNPNEVFNVAGMRGTGHYATWLDGLKDKAKAKDIVHLLELALECLAEHVEFKKPRPPRMGR